MKIKKFGSKYVQHSGGLYDWSQSCTWWACEHLGINLLVKPVLLTSLCNLCLAIMKRPLCCSTQQNSYSISHLLGTVTTQWLPLWQCSHCTVVPDTVTTEQWLHQTHTLLGIHYQGKHRLPKRRGLLDPLKLSNTNFKGSISILGVQLPCHFDIEISWSSSLQATWARIWALCHDLVDVVPVPRWWLNTLFNKS